MSSFPLCPGRPRPHLPSAPSSPRVPGRLRLRRLRREPDPGAAPQEWTQAAAAAQATPAAGRRRTGPGEAPATGRGQERRQLAGRRPLRIRGGGGRRRRRIRRLCKFRGEEKSTSKAFQFVILSFGSSLFVAWPLLFPALEYFYHTTPCAFPFCTFRFSFLFFPSLIMRAKSKCMLGASLKKINCSFNLGTTETLIITY